MSEIDNAIDEAGGFRWFQVALLVCSLVPLSLVGANMGASIFVAMAPEARCRSPQEDIVMKDCPSDFQSVLVPMVSGELSSCKRYNFTGRNISSLYVRTVTSDNSTACNVTASDLSEPIPCEHWEFDASVMRSTIVMDLELMCADRWAGYFAQSALMIGVGFGSMVAGTLSDKFGRRHAFLFSCIGSVIFGVALAFTKTYVAFCIVRSFLGFFAYAPFPILFVLNSEMTTPRHRSLSGQMLELGFPFGFMYLSLMAYLLREWRKVQLAITAPFALGIVIWWFMPESPRWLHQENRNEEAQKVIAKMAKVNRKEKQRDSAPTEQRELPGVPESSAAVTERDQNRSPMEQPHSANVQHNVLEAFKHPHLRCACLKLFYVWFTVSCVYYGLTLNAAEFGDNPFANLCLNSVAEIIGDFLAIPLLNTVGRRITYCVAGVLSGIFCIVVLFPSETPALAVAILGKLAISAAFGATTSGISICNAMARVGGVAAPLIAMLGITMSELPYIIFGVLSITAGLLVLTLPETRGVSLPQTMEEGEEFIASSAGFSCFECFKRKNRHKPTNPAI